MNSKLLISSFAKERGFVKYQLESFNDFVNFRLQKIITQIGEIKPEVPELNLKIKLGKIKLGKPSVKEADGAIRTVFPMEARLRNLTYAAPLYVEMTQVINDIEERPVMVHIGDLPVMVKSELCSTPGLTEQELVGVGEDPQDPGAYFIVNGTERALVLVEEISPNRIILEKKEGNVAGVARINSEKDGFVQRHIVEMKQDGIITASFANVHKIPIIILLKALGLETDKDIIASVSSNPQLAEEFYPNIYESEVKKVEDALDGIGKHLKVAPEYRKSRAEQVIDRYLLPHIGQKPENRFEKAKYLSKVAKKLIDLRMGNVTEDDLDHYANKRLRMSGDLLELLFRSILLGRWGLITRICYNYQKLAKRGKVPSVQSVVESNVLTNQLASSLATGAWVGGRTGVSQRLERGNFIRTLSHIRNVLSPLTTTQEHFEARELHLTHWGRLCPSETPEGPSIGLRKYLSIMAEATSGMNEKENKDLLESLNIENPV
ncbi:MAG: DNA-directed RNA polymerase subunit B'' [Candidatus Aenigmarchaeota archaeon]|nr:DNA-directed RNA polymerase subunit B'' [Candidatus Aenigmarchaeota archaeon]